VSYTLFTSAATRDYLQQGEGSGRDK